MLKDKLCNLRTGYFKELNILREQAFQLRSAVEQASTGTSTTAKREAFIQQAEIYFYDIRDALIEPGLSEIMKESIRLTQRNLAGRLFAMREKLVCAGIDPGDDFEYFSAGQSDETRESTLCLEGFPDILIPPKPWRDITVQASPLMESFEHQSAPETQDASIGTVNSTPALSLCNHELLFIYGRIEQSAPKRELSISTLESITKPQVKSDERGVNTAVCLQLVESQTQTVILYEETGTNTAGIKRVDCGQDAGPESLQSSQPQSRLLSARNLSSDERDFVEVYTKAFKESFMDHINRDSDKLVRRLLAASDSTPFLDLLQPLTESAEISVTTEPRSQPDSPCLTQRSSDHIHSPESNKLRRHALSLKAEISDLQGRLAVQSKRLSRALRFIDGIKRERDDNAAQASQSIARMKRVRETLYKLRKQLLSRDRQVRFLSHTLSRTKRGRDTPGLRMIEHLSLSPQGDQFSIAPSDDWDDDIFMQTTRNTARIQTFSFEPLTHRSEAPRIERESPRDKDRLAELLKQRHQLGLGSLHQLKPLIDDI